MVARSNWSDLEVQVTVGRFVTTVDVYRNNVIFPLLYTLHVSIFVYLFVANLILV
jgi:hypothetical protein